MANIFSTIVTVGVFCGWIIYLAGIARSNDICVQVGKGKMTQPIKSVGDMSKAVPIGGPWTVGFTGGASMGSSSSSSSSSSAADAAAAAAIAAALGRKMLHFGDHGRSLLDVVDNGCGWSYALEWWTVALQGIAVIGIIAIAFTQSATAHKLKPAFASFLYVNTALLCMVANIVIPITYNYNQTKVKGPAPDAVYASAAGILITLIFNFLYFIASSLDDHGSAVQPALVK